MLANLDLRKMTLVVVMIVGEYECHRYCLFKKEEYSHRARVSKFCSFPLQIACNIIFATISKTIQKIVFSTICMILNPISTSDVLIALSQTVFLNFVTRWR